MSGLRNVADRLFVRMSGFPSDWSSRDRLAEWEAAHASSSGDVWAVSPPCGYGWQLWRPGSPRTDHDFPYCDVEPAAVTLERTEDGCDNGSGWRLADVGPWLQSWVESVTGRNVAAMVEGLMWYGPDMSLAEYVIYARAT